MCLEFLSDGYIKADADHTFSLLFEKDAVEYIYKVVSTRQHEYSLYQLSSNDVVSELELAAMVQEHMDGTANVVTSSGGKGRCVLSGIRFEKEYGVHAFGDLNKNIEKMAAYMQKHKATFVNEDKLKLPWWKILWNKWKWLIRAIFPFVENLICFIPFFMLNNRTVGSRYFANLDPFLLYVLLFAIVYGQQQATFSAMCAVAGYMFRQMYTRSGFEVLLDYNTYVWIAQLFILGLVVGYMRDQIKTMRMESEELEAHLSRQITDIKDINESNVRVKRVMEQQLIDQKDSIGKIYTITQTLDQYMPDEARILGNSIRYKEMTEVYEELEEEKVYINKTMDPRYPLMARAIYEDGSIKMIIMLWGLSWEKMTLGQANFLTVVSYLIQNAVLRAQRYIQALEEKRYSEEGSRILSQEAFKPLVKSYMDAEAKDLAECVLLKVDVVNEQFRQLDETMAKKLRDSDYLGIMPDGNLYVLLANTTKENTSFVQERFEQNGYSTEIVEKIAACLGE